MEIRLSARKRQGEAAEARFLADASARGLIVCRPWGEDVPFDFVVQGRRRFHRVQIKSVWGARTRNERSYWVTVGHRKGSKRAGYRPAEVDFVVVYLRIDQVWYIIPVRALAGRATIGLGSATRFTRRLFERYREAWSLLR